MGKNEKISGRERVAKRRAALRAQGLRPKQIWIRDTSVPGFWEEASRQAKLIVASAHEAEDQAWVDEITDWDSWPEWKAD
ncbi:MAG TPA: antitoxin MazE family protein [Allosphingosinicella sp.]|jgi:hypothetical protein